MSDLTHVKNLPPYLIKPDSPDFEFFDEYPEAEIIWYRILKNQHTLTELGKDLNTSRSYSRKRFDFLIEHVFLPFFLRTEMCIRTKASDLLLGLKPLCGDLVYQVDNKAKVSRAHAAANRANFIARQISESDVSEDLISAFIIGQENLNDVRSFFSDLKNVSREFLSRPSQLQNGSKQFEIVILGKIFSESSSSR